MSENSIYSCLIYGCLIYFVFYLYVLRKWDSKMCIWMVILWVITIIHSLRALIINFSLHFFVVVMVNYWGDDCTGHPPPHLKYWGGGDISPHPPRDRHPCPRIFTKGKRWSFWKERKGRGGGGGHRNALWCPLRLDPWTDCLKLQSLTIKKSPRFHTTKQTLI